MKLVVIISTYPDKKSISKIANQLVKNKTVACVNISKISSIYSWKGKVENSSEYIAIFKTVPKNKSLLKKKIKETHPYDVPEIAEIDVNSINNSYLKWVIESTN
ncbi:MAG: divalent-cation tolerance protein CutA [Nitrosopumilus sp.]|uniref:divalent-cation tolerance protein CutA n=1 Tax=Nitrosopumilus sp. TaxID=2024843 RepID=UPI00246CFFEE|nr:divalent-cation tolerance protein CutA [Nitrosopumilus sp.]MDH5430778.1 divalent-cation tolerance protein CutA [Nitrosopumilus sp.]MDH5665634.1 divalent-cation tolerance protein CutA [Nitrosopumilus sp.]MDH5697656.1 divalent-cation tolerance protein CutA [Nitrosopumilus sp.]